MKTIFFLGIFSWLINYSCSDNKTDHFDKQTKILSAYLEDNFDVKPPNELHYFLFISKFRCEGCVQKNLNELDEYINQKKYKYFTLITSDLSIIPKNLSGRITILYDEKNKLDELDLNIANLTLVETKEKKIIFLKSFNPEDQAIIKYINL